MRPAAPAATSTSRARADWRAGAPRRGPRPHRRAPRPRSPSTSPANPPDGPSEPDFDDARPSAVLVVLADGAEGAEVLLTRRSMQLSNHRGEVSFPGGRVDPGETYEQAALREADEEVGLRPSIGDGGRPAAPDRHLREPQLDRARGGTVAAPVQLAATPARWTAACGCRCATSPCRARSARSGGTPCTGERPIFFFELDDETVWGATARMLHQLLRVAHGIEGPEPPAL